MEAGSRRPMKRLNPVSSDLTSNETVAKVGEEGQTLESVHRQNGTKLVSACSRRMRGRGGAQEDSNGEVHH